MIRKVRSFLGLEPSPPTGRWFSLVLLIGIGAALYSLVADWEYHSRAGHRASAIAKVVIIVVFGLAMIVVDEWERRMKKNEPPDAKRQAS